MNIKETLDKVGAAVQHDGITNIVTSAIDKWNNAAPTSSWWHVGGVNPIVATNFLIFCLDELVVELIEEDIPGPDKKATVIAAIDTIYGTVVLAMPIWMKPFSGTIRDYAVNVLASAAIDWIVAKYNKGDWNTSADAPTPSPEPVSSTSTSQ